MSKSTANQVQDLRNPQTRSNRHKSSRTHATRSRSRTNDQSEHIRDRELLQLLKRNKLMAVGDFRFNKSDKYSDRNPNGWYRPMPASPTPFEFQAYIRAAAQSKRVISIDLHKPPTSFLTPALQDEILRFIATQIPKSRWICVNLGEYSLASDDAYQDLLQAVKQSSVGFLFLDDRRIKRDSPLKNEFLKALQHNRNTNRLLHLQLAHPDAWAVLDKGCKAWRNPNHIKMRTTRERAKAYQQSAEGHGHCRNRCIAPRCKGVNASGHRCCLCTRDESGFCRFHRPLLNQFL